MVLRLPSDPPSRAPATLANVRLNARAGNDRARRWRPARDALWQTLSRHLRTGGAVAVVGAGNADDLPLSRLASTADRVDLIDIDPDAPRWARARLPRAQRRRVTVVHSDITNGVADNLALGAGGLPDGPPAGPIGHPPYDLVIGDLLYTQLLGPALGDLKMNGEAIAQQLANHGPALTAAVVERLHASAPVVVHVHDPLAWWPGHRQPFTIEQALRRATRDRSPAAVLAGARQPVGCDPRPALLAQDHRILETAWWRWPFTDGVDYLVCATVAATARAAAPDRPGVAASPAR